MSDLVVRELSKAYPTPTDPLVVLDGISLEMSRGESLAVVGPSGSGKSTLLSILGTLEEPTEGGVTLDGADPFTLDEEQLSGFRANQIGFVFQEHHLLPQCSVFENVLVPLLAEGSIQHGARERGLRLLERVGLSDRLMHRPAELSGGERQRAAIARALVREPLLVLADEPTGNLDSETARSVAGLLLELQQEQNSLLIAVTHSDELAAVMQHTARLRAGKLEPA